MASDTSRQFDPVRRLHWTVICGDGRGTTFDVGVRFRGEHDDGDFSGRWICTKEPDEIQTINRRHYQILENHRWPDLVGLADCFGWTGTIVQIDIGYVGKQAPHG
jgi:hypothetical protein